jgi:hypothetical protein
MPGPADDGPVTRDDVLPAGARQCFACGDANPIGMHLDDIRREGDEVHATLHPRPEYQGSPGCCPGACRRPRWTNRVSNRCRYEPAALTCPSVLGSSAVASVSQAAIAQVMTASRSARLAPSRACTDRPCTTVV